MQFLGDLVFGALCIGILGPWVVVTRARVAVRTAPGDTIAGLPVDVCVAARTRLRVRAVEPPGAEVFVGPVGRNGSVDDRITLLPTRRGVHGTLTLDIASAAPFALQWWTRRVHLPLPSELHVSPRCGPPAPVRTADHDDSGEVKARPRTDTGLPRGRVRTRPVTTGASCTGGPAPTPAG